MKVIKRGNIAILSLTLMIMIAGYINYRYNPEREKDLGKTVLVNSNDSYVYKSDDNVDVYSETGSRSGQTLYNSKTSNTISNIKSNREDMYSEFQSTYKEVIESASTSQENIKIYQDKLDSVIKEKHKINLAESLIKAKGIKDVVITKTDNKLNIVVSAENNLNSSKVAIIQKIIQDEFDITAENISIMQE